MGGSDDNYIFVPMHKKMENYLNLNRYGCRNNGDCMIKTRRVSDIYGMPVYTDDGLYYGDVEESVFSGNKVHGWRVRATKNSMLTRVLSGAKGVLIPHQFVKSIGDIMIVSSHALPSSEEAGEAVEEF